MIDLQFKCGAIVAVTTPSLAYRSHKGQCDNTWCQDELDAKAEQFKGVFM